MTRFFEIPTPYVIGLLMTVILCIGLFGCADQPLVVSGNGSCHPSSDLPAHKAVAAIPTTPTDLLGTYDLLVTERTAHVTDDNDYNSLYTECVDKTKAPVVKPEPAKSSWYDPTGWFK